MIYIYINIYMCVCEMQVGTACICMYTNRHTESHRVTFKACTTCPTASATWVKRRSDGRPFVRSQGPGRLSLAGRFPGPAYRTKLDGLFHGKTDLEMDDDRGYPHSRKAPYFEGKLT